MYSSSHALAPADHNCDRRRRYEQRARFELNFGPEDGGAPLTLDGQHLARVEEFKYLGTLVNADCRDSTAIAARTRAAAATYYKLHDGYCRGAIDKATKLKVYDAIVNAQLMFGAECWTPTAADDKRLDATQQQLLRRALGMNAVWLAQEERPHYPKRSMVLAAAERPRASDAAASAAVRFYGHVLRRPNNDDLRFVLRATVPGCVGAPSMGKSRAPADRMRALARAAGLVDEDAATRTRWRVKNRKYLKALTVRAADSSAEGDGAFSWTTFTAPDAEQRNPLGR